MLFVLPTSICAVSNNVVSFTTTQSLTLGYLSSAVEWLVHRHNITSSNIHSVERAARYLLKKIYMQQLQLHFIYSLLFGMHNMILHNLYFSLFSPAAAARVQKRCRTKKKLAMFHFKQQKSHKTHTGQAWAWCVRAMFDCVVGHTYLFCFGWQCQTEIFIHRTGNIDVWYS